MTRVYKGEKARSKPKLACRAATAGAFEPNHYHIVSYEAVEDVILKQHGAILADMPHPDAEVERELSNARGGVSELENRMSELMELLERRPSDALAKRVADLELSLKAAREELDAIETRAAHLDSKAVKLRCEALGLAIRARPITERAA